MQMRLHLLPQTTAPDKLNSYAKTAAEEMAAKQQVLFANNINNQ